MSTPDGLQALNAQRAKASARHTPPPRHGAPTTPPSPPATDRPTTVAPAAPPPAQSATDLSTPPEAEALVRASIYLDQTTDTYLEDVRTAGRRSTPKVDASRSAVVRLALSRLAEQLTPAELVDELRSRADRAAGGPGRKRL